ncbi:hypothetical protein GJAV_G00253290 [Gymnothorax javanicus]|nr:hypothetical protein GJAV_G00253290 [Gymnothorax javanicus]
MARPPTKCGKSTTPSRSWVLIHFCVILLLAGDVETNPGPSTAAPHIQTAPSMRAGLTWPPLPPMLARPPLPPTFVGLTPPMLAGLALLPPLMPAGPALQPPQMLAGLALLPPHMPAGLVLPPPRLLASPASRRPQPTAEQLDAPLTELRVSGPAAAAATTAASSAVGKINVVIPVQELKTREDFLQYSSQLTLDSNTVNKHLRLSEGNREVTRVRQIQSYPDHRERFESRTQVLCREGLSGRCYWEAEWRGDYGVYIAVSYKEISRKGKGDDCILGHNYKSWALRCSPSRYSFLHNNEGTKIPVPSSSRIGVYLDHRAGTLSFYSVSDTMTLLHRVQTTFTQPLYPGFRVYYYNSSVKLCDLG